MSYFLRPYHYAFSGASGTPGSSLTISSVTQIPNCTGYRLPTEAEWEYAARAGTTKAYANPIGFDDLDTEIGTGFNGNLHAMGWYAYNQNNMGYTAGRKPVAKKQANAWGLYDMHGNVSEWNWDWSGAYSGDANDPTGPVSGSRRLLRSGFDCCDARFSRSASRSNSLPGSRFGGSGFRLVLPHAQ